MKVAVIGAAAAALATMGIGVAQSTASLADGQSIREARTAAAEPTAQFQRTAAEQARAAAIWKRNRHTSRRWRYLRDKPWGGSVKKHARAMAKKRRR